VNYYYFYELSNTYLYKYLAFKECTDIPADTPQSGSAGKYAACAREDNDSTLLDSRAMTMTMARTRTRTRTTSSPTECAWAGQTSRRLRPDVDEDVAVGQG